MKTDDKSFYNIISDDEIRVVGNSTTEPPATNQPQQARQPVQKQPEPRNRFAIWHIIVAALALAAIVFALWQLMPPANTAQQEPVPDEPSEVNVIIPDSTTTSIEPEYADMQTDTINDIQLRIFTPHGGRPELVIGNLQADTTRIILAAQAADVRGDNGEISGAFILKGELISKGLPKLGFCSIINNEITIGRQSETPLFERAIEENGYFFRQYSLVSNGEMIDIKPKGKAIRRALCYLRGSICIIESTERESYHDFAQALADYGVEECVSLVGGEAILKYKPADSPLLTEGKVNTDYEYVNYIVWMSNK